MGVLAIVGSEGEHVPSENELKMARFIRNRVTTIVKKLRN
jgi:hypothetical protein